jgi:hypothetical protein
MIGSAVVDLLESRGDTIIRLVRPGTKGRVSGVPWDPDSGVIDVESLGQVDAIVNLSGESIADGRWTAKRKARLIESRVRPAGLLASTAIAMQPLPAVMVNASAYGHYGSQGDRILSEDDLPGSDFLSTITKQWEAASAPAADAGLRVVNLRLGVALSARGGALAKMLPVFRRGLGGKLGPGRQYISWLTLHDAARAFAHALDCEDLHGPVNTATPNPVTNLELTRTLGKVLKRPTMFGVPAFALRIIFGELADTLLFSARVDSAKLLGSGFAFEHPDLEGALRSVLRRPA